MSSTVISAVSSHLRRVTDIFPFMVNLKALLSRLKTIFSHIPLFCHRKRAAPVHIHQLPDG